MTSVTDKRITPAPLQQTVQNVAIKEHVTKAATVAGETADQVAVYADGFETAGSVAKKGRDAFMAVSKHIGIRDGNAARAFGAVVGAVAQHMGNPKVLAGASKLGDMMSMVLESKIVQGAGIASIAWNTYKAATDDESTTNMKVANSAATLAVGAAAFVPGIGQAILVAEVLSGGGVTGVAKGLAALANSAFTGDHSGVEKWVEDARSGEHGWAVSLGMKAADKLSEFSVSKAWNAIKAW